MIRWLATLLLLLCATIAHAQTFPALSGRVVDRANLLDAATERRIAARSALLQRRTGHQFVVVTVRSLGRQSIDRYSLALFNHWAIGRRGINDGIGLLVALRERKVRIEVGKGLETTLTNAEAKRIIDNNILPEFRRNQISRGVERGANAIAMAVAS